jgi:hypothetical protein
MSIYWARKLKINYSISFFEDFDGGTENAEYMRGGPIQKPLKVINFLNIGVLWLYSTLLYKWSRKFFPINHATIFYKLFENQNDIIH